MISIKPCLNKFRAIKGGKYPLVIQLIYFRRKKLIRTPYHLLEESFDDEKRMVVSRRDRRVPQFKEMNKYIEDELEVIDNIISQLKLEGETFSVDDIANRYRQKDQSELLIPYIHKLMEELLKQERHGSYNAYRSTANRISQFIKDDKKFTFEHITVKWLNSFVEFMSKDGICSNTVNFYMRMFRAVYNRAADEGVVGIKYPSPFSKVTVKTVETVKRAITVDEVNKISVADLSFDPKMERARDCFMISIYGRGMSFVDIVHLKKSDIENGIIRYRRSKTGQPLQVKIVKQLNVLLDKYLADGDYVLPVVKSEGKKGYLEYRAGLRSLNDGLKKLSQYLGLSTSLTSYVARHTWATLAKRSGVPISVISESMGHKSEKTTNIYLASLDSKVLDDANQQVADICTQA